MTVYGTENDDGSWSYDYVVQDCWAYGNDGSISSGADGPGAVASSVLPAGLVQSCGSESQTAASQEGATLQQSDNMNQEYYGWIYSDGAGGTYNTPPTTMPFNENNLTVSIGPPPSFPGYTATAYYHTHPGLGKSPGDDVQAGTSNHFSPADYDYANTYKINGYVGLDQSFTAGQSSRVGYMLSYPSDSETSTGQLSKSGC